MERASSKVIAGSYTTGGGCGVDHHGPSLPSVTTMTAGVLLRSGWRRTSTLVLRWVMSKQATFMMALIVVRGIGGLDRREGYRTCVL